MTNTPQIKPLALAYITEYGAQTVQSLDAVLPFNIHAIAKVLRQMADRGEIDIVLHERVGNGSFKLHYGLPVSKEYPRIGATEYLPWHPTGSRPESVRRLVSFDDPNSDYIPSIVSSVSVRHRTRLLAGTHRA